MPSTSLWADNAEYWDHVGEKTRDKIDKQIKPIGRLLKARSDGTLIVLVVFNNPGEGEKWL